MLTADEFMKIGLQLVGYKEGPQSKEKIQEQAFPWELWKHSLHLCYDMGRSP
jgi:hypothetical protein